VKFLVIGQGFGFCWVANCHLPLTRQVAVTAQHVKRQSVINAVSIRPCSDSIQPMSQVLQRANTHITLFHLFGQYARAFSEFVGDHSKFFSNNKNKFKFLAIRTRSVATVK